MRAVARGIDIVILYALQDPLPKSGWAVGLAYLLVADGLFGGQSLGKKVVGLRVITKDGLPCGIRESLLRNSPLALGYLFYQVPFVGKLIFGAALLFEFVVALGNKEGARMGDEISGTRVMLAAAPAKEQ